MVFAKPNVVVVLDEVAFNGRAKTLEARFFPDNRDGLAAVEAKRTGFRIQRPNATLFGGYASTANAAARTDLLELVPVVNDGSGKDADKDFGEFPFIGIKARAAVSHSLVTVMVARPGNTDVAPGISIRKVDAGWATITVTRE